MAWRGRSVPEPALLLMPIEKLEIYSINIVKKNKIRRNEGYIITSYTKNTKSDEKIGENAFCTVL